MIDDPTTDDGDRTASPAAERVEKSNGTPGSNDATGGDKAGGGSDGGMGSDRTGATDGAEAVRRRWLLRGLVGLGIGLPILIEARTFIGLIRVYLLGSEPGDGATTDTPTPTAEPSVGVGDELLPANEPTETLQEAHLRVVDSGWRFELSVAVENTTDVAYELRLGDIRTEAGDTVDGDASTGQIPPGESAVLEETWALPSQSNPDTLQVTTLSYAEEGVDLGDETVPLARVPVEG